MTSPCEQINVACPACGTVFETWHRASVNVGLDPDLADPSYLHEVSTGSCPTCGHQVPLAMLVVDGNVWTLR
jgi:hypothetical protein